MRAEGLWEQLSIRQGWRCAHSSTPVPARFATATPLMHLLTRSPDPGDARDTPPSLWTMAHKATIVTLHPCCTTSTTVNVPYTCAPILACRSQLQALILPHVATCLPHSTCSTRSHSHNRRSRGNRHRAAPRGPHPAAAGRVLVPLLLHPHGGQVERQVRAAGARGAGAQRPARLRLW